MVKKERTYVTVCDQCLRASCWLGYFMCDRAGSAGKIDLDVDYLRVRALENPCWWEPPEVVAASLPSAVLDR